MKPSSLGVKISFLVVVVVMTMMPTVVLSMGIPTSIFGILRNRMIFAGAVNEQQQERFEQRNSGFTILKSFPSAATGGRDGGVSNKAQLKQ